VFGVVISILAASPIPSPSPGAGLRNGASVVILIVIAGALLATLSRLRRH
jgi:hypothetical protein